MLDKNIETCQTHTIYAFRSYHSKTYITVHITHTAASPRQASVSQDSQPVKLPSLGQPRTETQPVQPPTKAGFVLNILSARNHTTLYAYLAQHIQEKHTWQTQTYNKTHEDI